MEENDVTYFQKNAVLTICLLGFNIVFATCVISMAIILSAPIYVMIIVIAIQLLLLTGFFRLAFFNRIGIGGFGIIPKKGSCQKILWQDILNFRVELYSTNRVIMLKYIFTTKFNDIYVFNDYRFLEALLQKCVEDQRLKEIINQCWYEVKIKFNL